MKKVIALMGFLALGLGNTFAQDVEKKHAAGVDINYATQVDNVGIGVKYQWKVGKKKRLYIEPNFHYYLPKNGMKVLDVGVNFKWAFKLIDKLKVYPLVGLGYSNTDYGTLENAKKYHDSGSLTQAQTTETKLEWNIGVGAQYDFSDKWAGTFEFKRANINNGMLIFGVGALYKF